MPLAEKEQLWVDRFTGVRTPAADLAGLTPLQLKEELVLRREKEEVEEQARKEQLIDRVTRNLEAEKVRMQRAFRMQLELEGKAISTMGKGGDQTRALDTAEVSRVTRGPSSSEYISASEMMDILVGQKKILESAHAKRSKLVNGAIVLVDEPLFSHDEVADELYEPLVRQMILPENFVPSKYSKTQKMIDGSNDYYLKELATISEPDETAEKIETASKMVELSGKILKMVPGQGHTAELVEQLSEAVITTALAGAKSVVKSEGSGGVLTLVNNLSGIVEKILKEATGNADLAELVALTMKGGATATIGVLAPLVGSDPPDVNGLISNLGTHIETCFALANNGQPDDRKAAILTSVGTSLAAAFELAAKARAAKIGAAIKAGKWPEVGKLIAEATSAAGKQAMGVARTLDKTGKSDDKKGAIDKAGKVQDKGADDAAKGFAGLMKFQGDLLSEAAKARLAEGKKEKAKEIKAIQKQLDDEQTEFESALDQLGEAEPELKSIAKLMAKMKHDAVIMATATAVMSGGMKAASFFFEPLALAGTAVTFLNNLAAAAQRAMHMRKWIDSRRDAMTAVSPYLTSIQNFVTNQKEQMSHHAIKSALNLVQIGSQIAAIGMPFAKVVSAGAQLAESMEELTYKFYNERAVKSAWKLTRQALDNPDNRKLGLLARRQNPTLAKYSIAYGAIVAKDTIAITALNRCGLDRETLSQKDSNVGAVKDFLELLYKDDRVVKKEYESSDWRRKLPRPALNVRCWLQTYTLAARSLGLRTENPSNVVTLLKKIGELAKAPNLDASQCNAYLHLLQELAGFLEGFRPKTEHGVEKPEMAPILQEFVELAEIEMARVNEIKNSPR